MESLRNWGFIGQHTGNYLSPGITISSFHVEQLKRSIALMPEIAHGWLLQKINKSSLRVALDLGLSGIYPNAMNVTKHQIDIADESGLSVRTWGKVTLCKPWNVRINQGLLARQLIGLLRHIKYFRRFKVVYQPYCCACFALYLRDIFAFWWASDFWKNATQKRTSLFDW